MIDPADVPVSPVGWEGAVRIIRSVFPPIDLFEDIADPADWPLLISAEQKTNPRLNESIGTLDLVPPERRVGGPGASYLMAPFTHTSPDRPSRFSDGQRGVLYIATEFDTAVHETAHHHARFMKATGQEPGWVAQFRALTMDVGADLHDLRGDPRFAAALDPDDYTVSQSLGGALRKNRSDGVVYPSVRGEGECVGLFYPDLATPPSQTRHLSYHWNGTTVDLIRDETNHQIYRLIL